MRLLLRRRLQRLAALALAGLLLAAGYLGAVAVRRVQPRALPAPAGPDPVGRVRDEWTDPGRRDPLAPRPTTGRTLAVWLWYPAAPAPGAPRAAYLPGRWASLQGPLLSQSFLFEDFHAVGVHAVEAAPVARVPARLHVLVLAPGLGTFLPYHTSLAEDLASRGYLVAGVNPTYSADLTVLAGRVVGPPRAGQQPGDPLAEWWTADLRFVVDRLAALERGPGGPFAGRLELSRVGLFGHSFGGAAAP